tara:strand:+ start:1794 stop:1910 length:117 start_codon:yes stop_codon:yes gene_type:complete
MLKLLIALAIRFGFYFAGRLVNHNKSVTRWEKKKYERY